MSECRYFHIDAGKGLRRLPTLADALLSKQAGGYLWMDLLDPTRADLDALAKPLGIHALAVEDCLDEDQVPKIEDYPGHNLILFNRYACAHKQLTVEEVDALQGKDFLVTVNRRGGTGPRAFERIEELAGLDIANVEKGPDFLLHVILDHTVDGKLATIEAIEEDIEVAKEETFRALEVAFDYHHIFLPWGFYDDQWFPWRAHPRWQEYRRRLNFPPN